MVDPLAEVVTLLQPSLAQSKLVSAAGPWRVRRSEPGRPFYCVILDGCCRLAVNGYDPIIVQAGDFVLIPEISDFMMSSREPPASDHVDTSPVALPNGEFRHGLQNAAPEVLLLLGRCVFGSPDAALLVSLLPRLVHVRSEKRLTTLVQLVSEESRDARPARDVILARLLEVLLIEALRSTRTHAFPGILRGLADERLAVAMRSIHGSPTRAWTVSDLAMEAALSRSAFFERFKRALGVPPMEYLLAWRMALAKNLLRQRNTSVADVAERVGYGSASTFSTAFTRHVGLPPTRYANQQLE